MTKHSCVLCDYETGKLSDYKKHVLTKKHKVNYRLNSKIMVRENETKIKSNETKSNKNETVNVNIQCKYCMKTISRSKNLKRHYDICKSKIKYDVELEKNIIELEKLDLEEKLNIKIPHSPEYETIGGYIFHIAGTIPSKGWKIHLENFDIEILNSNERCIEKISITPLKKENN